jgi:hypothetical protein
MANGVPVSFAVPITVISSAETDPIPVINAMVAPATIDLILMVSLP